MFDSFDWRARAGRFSVLLLLAVPASPSMAAELPSLALDGVRREYSVLPRAQGFEIRAYGEIRHYDQSGALVGTVGDQSIESPLWERFPSSIWVPALPAQHGYDALHMAVAPSQPCSRFRLEDGRHVTRIDALVPAPLEGGSLPPPNNPTPPPAGSLGWANHTRDPAHLSGLAARDRDGIVYALAWRFGSSPSFWLRAFGPDCRPLDGGPPRDVLSFDAHPSQPGAYVVSPGWFNVGPRLWRTEAGQITWEVELAPPSMWASTRPMWLRALEDGGVLAVEARGNTLILRVFDASGQFNATNEIAGRSVAALREEGGSFLLAVGDSLDRAGARQLVELDRTLRELHRIVLEEGFVLGPVSSQAAGSRSAEWLVHEDDRALERAERRAPSRYGALRMRSGGLVQWLLPMGELRPRLVLEDEHLLVSRGLAAEAQLALVGPDRVPRWLDGMPRPPLVPLWPLPWDAFSDGRVARILRSDSEQRLVLQQGSASLWEQSLMPSVFQRLHAEGEAARVCVSDNQISTRGEFGLQCFRLEDGAPGPQHRWSGLPETAGEPAGGLGAGGAVSVFLPLLRQGSRSAVWHLRADARTGAVSTAVIPAWYAGACAQSQLVYAEPVVGAAVLEMEDGPLYLRRYASNGDLLWRRELPADVACPEVLAISNEGDVLLGEFGDMWQRDQPQRLLAVSASDGVRWRADVTALGMDRPTASFAFKSKWRGVPGRWVGLSLVEGAVALLAVDARNGNVLDRVRLTAKARYGLTWNLARASSPAELLLLEPHSRGAFLRRLSGPMMRLGRPVWGGAIWHWEDRRIRLVGEELLVPRFTPSGEEDMPVSSGPAPLLAADRPLGPEHSGMWYDPTLTGHGLMLDVEASTQRWFGAWFTFATPGEAGTSAGLGVHEGLRWYSMLGQGSAASGLPIAGTLYFSAGGRFDGGTPLTSTRGEVHLRAIDCNSLEFQYRIEPASGSSPAIIGTRSLVRLGPPPSACGGASVAEQAGLKQASTGSWVLEGRPNQGVLMQVDPGAAGQAGGVWGAWFGFDAGDGMVVARPQHWLTLSGRKAIGQPGVVELEWMRTTAGLLDTLRTTNTHVIGSGRLRFTACDRAVLEYSFDAPGLPGDAFAGLQGQVNLRRFDPCG